MKPINQRRSRGSRGGPNSSRVAFTNSRLTRSRQTAEVTSSQERRPTQARDIYYYRKPTPQASRPAALFPSLAYYGQSNADQRRQAEPEDCKVYRPTEHNNRLHKAGDNATPPPAASAARGHQRCRHREGRTFRCAFMFTSVCSGPRTDAYNGTETKMLDFSELPTDGVDFERLVREMLLAQGYRPYWTGKGPDGGRDLLCDEERTSAFRSDSRTWLIECKHFAGSGRSVGVDDLGDIYGKCAQHNADGYLLVCSTYPSSAVVNRLEGFCISEKQRLLTTYWDGVHLERLLSAPRLWSVCQRFLPKSAQAKEFKIFGTLSPSQWVVAYRGFYFHLVCRIGSSHAPYLDSIADGVARIMKLKLSEHQEIRIRRVYCDDKNGNIAWTLDYLLEQKTEPKIGSLELQRRLGHEQNDAYGQIQFVTVRYRICDPGSDHFDPDHEQYYDQPYTGRELTERQSSKLNALDVEWINKRAKRESALASALNSLSGIRVIRSIPAYPEVAARFSEFDWAPPDDLSGVPPILYASRLIIESDPPTVLLKLAQQFPSSVERHFRLAQVHFFDDGVHDEEDDTTFDLEIAIFPNKDRLAYESELLLEQYYRDIIAAIAAARQG